VKGWAHVVPHARDSDVLLKARTWWLLDRRSAAGAAQPIDVQNVRRHGAALVAKWAGCDDPESVEALRDAPVAVPRSAFPATGDGEYYWLDLLGATVVNRSGVTLGQVTGLRSNGAQDLLEVSGGGAQAQVLLVPLVEQYVDRVDLEGRRIEVDWEADW
jgi:16S rRNA processing protein RimM